jgi:hypothetical protein
MASSSQDKSQTNSKALKEISLIDPILPYRVLIEILPFTRVPLLKSVDYNFHDPH